MLTNQRFRWLHNNQNDNQKQPYIRVLLLDQDRNRPLIRYNIDRQQKQVRVQSKQLLQCWQGDPFTDMCQMKILNQPEILNNLVIRLKNGHFYTNLGQTLIFLNPYKNVDLQYSDQVMKGILKNAQKDMVGSCIMPHIYAKMAQIYEKLCLGKNQVIVISGESGAGKTQNTKYCLKMLNYLTGAGKHVQISQKIISCNYILEVFGNAKTIKNDNSSRFGKYLKVSLNDVRQINGASLECYLLEKSRVVNWAEGERSFHIFYTIEQAAKLFPQQKLQNFHFSIEELCKCFADIDIGTSEIKYILNITSAIAWLNKITFNEADRLKNDKSTCKIEQYGQLKLISQLLAVKIQQLQKFLLYQRKTVLKEEYLIIMDKFQCQVNRNTFCKTLYNEIFQILLKKMSKVLRGQQSNKSMSFLDIFGFENFKNNSLQQLCINFANQRLLKLYNEHVFENEIKMLEQDGINTSIFTISPPNNEKIISTMSSKLSIFSIINDLTIPKQFTDMDMLQCFKNQLKNSLINYDFNFPSNFCIRHSHCVIQYNIKEFKVKNQDKATESIKEMIHKIVGSIQSYKEKTIIHKFTTDMESLIDEMKKSQINFIRCIKPNQNKSSTELNLNYILNQVRYLGIFQTIELRQSNMPYRQTYSQFSQHYYKLLKFKELNKEKMNKLLTSLVVKGFILGKQRIYYTSQVNAKLEIQMLKIVQIEQRCAVKIQLFYKRYKEKQLILIKLKEISTKIKCLKAISFYYLKRLGFGMIKIKKWATQKKKNKTIGTQNIFNSILSLYKRSMSHFFINLCIIERTLDKSKASIKTYLQSPMNDSLMQDPNILKKLKKYKYNLTSSPNLQNIQTNNLKLYDTARVQLSQNNEKVFKNCLQVKRYQQCINPNISILQSIVQLDNNIRVELDYCVVSNLGSNSEFDISKKLSQKLENLDLKEFFRNTLRVRTNFFGMRKSYEQILKFKDSSISKSLTLINKKEDLKAIQSFKLILKICREGHIKQTILYIGQLISLCEASPLQLINEVLIQILRQINSHFQLCIARMCQLLVVFIHKFSPDRLFLQVALLTLLKMFKNEQRQNCIKQNEQIFRYAISKLALKVQNNYPNIFYLPTKYHIRALVGRKQLPVAIAFPTGRSIILNCQSHQTLIEIKQRALNKFGINIKRFPVDLFGFFEAATYNNAEIQESPILQSQSVWDTLAIWQQIKVDNQLQGIEVSFRFMLRIKFAFSCYAKDWQGILLCYSHCIFDFLIGRLKLESQDICKLSALAYIIESKQSNQILNYLLPDWFLQNNKMEDINKQISLYEDTIKDDQMSDIQLKYAFLKICDKSPLAMSTVIPTNQGIKLFLKPRKLYIVLDGEIIRELSFKEMIKWYGDADKFQYEVMKEGQRQNRTHAVFTEHAAIILDYLSSMSKLRSFSKQFHLQN